LIEVLEPGTTVSAVADRNGISRSQLYAWKRLAQRGGIPGISLNGLPGPLFAPVSNRGCAALALTDAGNGRAGGSSAAATRCN
jgi:transposase-like protein